MNSGASHSITEDRQPAADEDESGGAPGEPAVATGTPRGGIHRHTQPGPDEGQPATGEQRSGAGDRGSVNRSVHPPILSQDPTLLALARVEC